MTHANGTAEVARRLTETERGLEELRQLFITELRGVVSEVREVKAICRDNGIALDLLLKEAEISHGR